MPMWYKMKNKNKILIEKIIEVNGAISDAIKELDIEIKKSDRECLYIHVGIGFVVTLIIFVIYIFQYI